MSAFEVGAGDRDGDGDGAWLGIEVVDRDSIPEVFAGRGETDRTVRG